VGAALVTRSQYRRIPRPVYSNAHTIAMRGSGQLDRADVDGMWRLFERALREFSSGKECATHWRSLADACNLAETLASLFPLANDPESRQRIAAGQRVLADVFQRYQLHKSWTLHAAELEALRVALLIHDVQLRHCSATEFAQAFDHTRERLHQAQAGNPPAGSIVLRGQL
jgi:hypothetical protein